MMPSDPRFGPHPAEPGIAADRGEQPPEVGAPPRRTSPKTLLLVGVSTGFFFVVLIPQLLFSRSTSTDAQASGNSSLGLVFALVPVLLSTGIATVAWFARTYVVGVDELVIDEGVLRRRRRVVPYARVQQVDIDQKLLAQLFRLGTLTIETAGTAGGKVRLGMLDIGVARGLRRFVLTRRAEVQGGDVVATRGPTAAGPAPGVAPAAAPLPPQWADRVAQPVPSATRPPMPTPLQPPPERVLFRLDGARLAVAGVTHHFVVALVPGLLLAGLVVGALAVPDDQGAAPLVILVAASGIALLVAAVVAAMMLAQYVVGRYGFTLSEQGDDLHLRYGLLQVRNVTIPRRRVQHVTVVDNPLRRALGLVGVQLHSAAPAVDVQASLRFLDALQAGAGGEARFEIPIVSRADLDGLLHALMGGDWQVPRLDARPAAARRRAVTRRVGVLALVMVVPACAFPPGSLLLGLVALLGVPWGLVAHRRAGYAQTSSLVVLARGVLHHRIELLPVSRVQSAAAVQTPFQRLAGLRTLHVNVAGRTADPRLSDLSDAAALCFTRDLPRRSAPRPVAAPK